MARRESDRPRAAPAVILVTALRAEARPLIERYGLSRADDVAGSPYFHATGKGPGNVAGGSYFDATGEHPGNAVPERHVAGAGTVALVVSGPGRIAAGAAVAAVASVMPSAAWLNVGIAGHADHRLGSPFLAHRVREVTSGRAWYPPLVFAPPCPTAGLATVDTPCEDFPDDDLYDMEGAGFYEIAGRCAPHELVHCLKVVSDNRENPARDLDAARVRELIGDSLAVIDAVVEQLAALAGEQRRLESEPAGFEDVLAAAHFSVTRRRQLRRALRRWAILCPDTDPGDWLRGRAARSAAEILTAIGAHLDSRPAPLRTLGRSPHPQPPEPRLE
ncbi:MAG: hypothetical protein PVJ51_04650 [Acidobacteriota bacterium]